MMQAGVREHLCFFTPTSQSLKFIGYPLLAFIAATMLTPACLYLLKPGIDKLPVLLFKISWLQIEIDII